MNKSEAKRLFRVLGSCFPGTCPQFLIGPPETPTVNSFKKKKALEWGDCELHWHIILNEGMKE